MADKTTIEYLKKNITLAILFPQLAEPLMIVSAIFMDLTVHSITRAIVFTYSNLEVYAIAPCQRLLPWGHMGVFEHFEKTDPLFVPQWSFKGIFEP